MSHNRQKTTSFNSDIINLLSKSAIIAMVLFMAGILALRPASAKKINATKTSAAIKPANMIAISATKLAQNPKIIMKASLAEISGDNIKGHDKAVLDWRTNNFTLNFDLPAHNRYEKLDLFLRIYPKDRPTSAAPIKISFNGAEPISIHGKARAFDTHIRLETRHIRTNGNIIQISFAPPFGQDCILPENGRWIIDLERSKLIASARPKNRDMQIAEIKKMLASPISAPRRVSIVAKGKNKLAYQALIAQSVSARMKFVPDFKLSGNADMKIIIGKNADISHLVNNKAMLNEKGAVVFVDSGIRPKLVLSAPREDQLLEIARAFLSYELPEFRRAAISLFDFYSSTPLKTNSVLDNGTYKLADIGQAVLTQSWRPKPAKVKFNVENPNHTYGKMTLRILSAKDINPKSRLSLSLNGQSLGYTRLNKSTKLVEYNIKQGQLKPVNNIVEIKPDIRPAGDDFSCETLSYIPTVLVSGKSKLKLTSNNHKKGLGMMAASGKPFDQDSVIILPAKNQRELLASLKILGWGAQKFGSAWAKADYLGKLPPENYRNKNILIIGARPILEKTLLKTAPNALGNTNRYYTGLAALYPSPYAKGRVIGIIGAQSSARFASAARKIANNDFWNRLDGSVVRWDNKNIIMAQTSVDLPEFAQKTQQDKPQSFTDMGKNTIAGIKSRFAKMFERKYEPVKTASNQQALPNSTVLRGSYPAKIKADKKPLFSFSDVGFNLPKINKPSIKLSDIKLPEWQGSNELRIAIKRKITDVKVWWKQDIISGSVGQKANKWFWDLAKRPALFVGVIVFLCLFIVALLSPMRSRIRPKRRRIGGKYF